MIIVCRFSLETRLGEWVESVSHLGKSGGFRLHGFELTVRERTKKRQFVRLINHLKQYWWKYYCPTHSNIEQELLHTTNGTWLLLISVSQCSLLVFSRWMSFDLYWIVMRAACAFVWGCSIGWIIDFPFNMGNYWSLRSQRRQPCKTRLHAPWPFTSRLAVWSLLF